MKQNLASILMLRYTAKVNKLLRDFALATLEKGNE